MPVLPDCLTYGESIEDALTNAREAATAYIESLVAHGEPVPIEEHPTIATSVVFPAPGMPEPAVAATAMATKR